jgi:hypothetical protein
MSHECIHILGIPVHAYTTNLEKNKAKNNEWLDGMKNWLDFPNDENTENILPMSAW